MCLHRGQPNSSTISVIAVPALEDGAASADPVVLTNSAAGGNEARSVPEIPSVKDAIYGDFTVSGGGRRHCTS